MAENQLFRCSTCLRYQTTRNMMKDITRPFILILKRAIFTGWSRQDDHQRRQGGIYAVVPESCQHGAAELPGI